MKSASSEARLPVSQGARSRGVVYRPRVEPGPRARGQTPVGYRPRAERGPRVRAQTPVVYRPHVEPGPRACGEASVAYGVGWRRAVRPESESAILRSDALALSIKAARDRAVLPLARAAAAFVDAGEWSEHGYARLEDHARERFGRSGRWVRDLAALGTVLDSLPALAGAVTGEDGGRPLGRVAALLIGRVVSPESLGDWIRLARSVTVRQLRAAVREALGRDSDRPPEAGPDPSEGGSSPEAPTDRSLSSALVDPALADPPCLVKIAVPSPVSAAFDETLDLYRAVVGSEATVTSFIEALVGEARSNPVGEDPDALDDDADPVSPFPPLPRGVQAPPLSHGLPAERREAIWARATTLWSRLPREADAGWALALAGLDPSDEGAGAGEEGTGNDASIRRLIRTEDRLDRLLGRVLAEMSSLGAWVRLGFAGLGHYAEERLGMCRSTACERAAAARQAPVLPVLFRAYQDGEIGLEAALRIARLLRGRAVEEAAVAQWVARARESTVKRLKDEMRALARDGVLSRRSEAEVAPRPLDDATWHRSLRKDRGTARGWVRTFGLATLLQPEPDVFLSVRLPADLAGELLDCIRSACRGLARIGSDESATSGEDHDASPPSVRAARWMIGRRVALPGWLGLLALLEDFVSTWDPEAGATPKRSPSSEEVYIRDGWRCSAPGCTSRRNLEDHHIVYRSRGGSHDLSNRSCLCRFHHQMGEHGGRARCRGTAPLGLTWRLGRPGLRSVQYRNELRLAEA